MTSDIRIEANPRKTRSVRRLGSMDIAELRAAVLATPEAVWDSENASKPNRFEALGTTRHIVLRFISSMVDWRGSYDRPAWEAWKPLVEPILRAATADYGYDRLAFPRVMIARTAAGGVIHPHKDQNPAAAWPHKIHVPLKTSEDVVFTIGGTPYHFPEGEAVEVNNLEVHSVENRGTEDRIHLIFECYDVDQPDPQWLAPLLRRQQLAS